uniref:Ig-like domain-containing protein n=1 Tax=Dicentrarchus labrax TaxID=13489 RepID=A0A8P4GNH1_DICLA
ESGGETYTTTAVEWTRTDLEPEYVLYYSDGHLDPYYQHPSFKGRVDLTDRELKDGNVSLVLKNVIISDRGTYECRVAKGGSDNTGITDRKTIRTIQLEVTASGELVDSWWGLPRQTGPRKGSD